VRTTSMPRTRCTVARSCNEPAHGATRSQACPASLRTETPSGSGALCGVDYWFRSRNGAIAATNSSGCCRGGQ
jgi:hypothetical protein